MNSAEIKILELIRNNPAYKTTDFVNLTKYSEVYINKIIRRLKDKKYIKRVGSNKNGYWDILKQYETREEETMIIKDTKGEEERE